MSVAAPYDEIADWYESVFLADSAPTRDLAKAFGRKSEPHTFLWPISSTR